MIPRPFIDQLVAQADIVEVINQRVPLKKRGSNSMACCPFHDEKTPSFSVNGTKQFYYCFGCGATGNVITFLMEYENIEFVEAVEVLAQHEGVEVPYEKRGKPRSKEEEERFERLNRLLTEAVLFFEQQLLSPVGRSAQTYLSERNVTAQDRERYRIGFAPEGWSHLRDYLQQKGFTDEEMLAVGLLSRSDSGRVYDRFRQRIIFPIHNRRGAPIGFGGRILGEGEPKYLNSPETLLFKKGHELYGLYELRHHERKYDEIIVVEGYMDVVMLAHYGVGNVVATLGTAIAERQIEMLFRYTSHVVICFDGDRAGRQAADKALHEALAILPAGKELSFLFLPEGEDPDTFVQKNGEHAFREAIAEATPLSQYLFEMLKREIDITTREGRSQLLAEASALINRMRDTPLRDILRADLAKETDVSEEVLQRHVERRATPTSRPLRERRFRIHEDSLPQPFERMISLLLNHPPLADEVTNFSFLLELEDIRAPLLYELLQWFKENRGQMNHLGKLFHHFADRDELPYLQQLATRRHLIESESHQREEFITFLQRETRHLNPKYYVTELIKNGEKLTDRERLILQRG